MDFGKLLWRTFRTIHNKYVTLDTKRELTLSKTGLCSEFDSVSIRLWAEFWSDHSIRTVYGFNSLSGESVSLSYRYKEWPTLYGTCICLKLVRK